MMQCIINADDFGLSYSCTRAICEAFQKGLITDTTMVANGEAYDEAIQSIQNYQLQDKIGIHFNLTECVPLTDDIKRCSTFCSRGKFHGKVKRLKPLTKFEKVAIYKELEAQIIKINRSGIFVSHADSHHHIHTALFIAPIVVRVCKEHGITKIRLHRNIGCINLHKRIVKKLFNIWLHWNGFRTTKFFGSLEDIENKGICENVEIMVHPDYDEKGNLINREYDECGFAVGQQLYSLKNVNDLIELSSYYEV